MNRVLSLVRHAFSREWIQERFCRTVSGASLGDEFLHICFLLCICQFIEAAVPIGVVDIADQSVVSGWAGDPDNPNVSIDLHIYVDGRFHAALPANQPREPAVCQALGSNATECNHGFAWNPALLESGSHTIRVYAVGVNSNGTRDGANAELHQSPRTITISKVENHTPMGTIETANQSVISGWAGDPDNPNVSIDIHIYVDGQFTVALPADKPRESAVCRSLGSNATKCNHGFAWSPAALESGSHTVRIYALGINSNGMKDGANSELGQSPKVVTISKVETSAPIGRIEVNEGKTIAGWAKDDDHGRSIDVHIYIDGKIVTALTADMYHAGLAGNYGFRWTHNRNFGPGSHDVQVYGIGVGADGQPDNINGELFLSARASETFTEPREYGLLSSDSKIELRCDALYGGIIGYIEDKENSPGKNLIINHPGAGLQAAWWLLPKKEKSQDCPETDDMYQINPTQGGYYADVVYGGCKRGNPIGLQGTERFNPFDSQEFIRFEKNGSTIHLKTKMIRHDFCINDSVHGPAATMNYRNLWDTEWYIEQWISFDKRFLHTIRLRSKIAFIGETPVLMDSRQLPVIFSDNLARVAYWKDGQKVIRSENDPLHHPSSGLGFYTDSPWAALVAQDTEAGLGMVFNPSMACWNPVNAQGDFCFLKNDAYPKLWESRSGHVFLNTIGTLSGVSTSDNGRTWRFDPAGTFVWDVYFPVGTIDEIKACADHIMGKAWATTSGPSYDVESLSRVGQMRPAVFGLEQKITASGMHLVVAVEKACAFQLTAYGMSGRRLWSHSCGDAKPGYYHIELDRGRLGTGNGVYVVCLKREGKQIVGNISWVH